MTQREGYKTRIHSGYKSQQEKISLNILILMILQFKNTTKITDRKLLMCAAYVFRSLYLNFGRGTHHIYIILHVAVFNSLLQFEIAMFDFPLQFFTCASIRTSEFLRHTTISLIKLFKRYLFTQFNLLHVFGKISRIFFGYVISLPLVLKSFQLISASYPWF